MVQKACGDEAEEDASFAFTLESATFKLPLVRFSYDVSPPPPPPMEMSAYRDIVDDDPEAYVEMRRRLESWFPKLSHVATSSVGAGIGPFIADFHVTPHQLT